MVAYKSETTTHSTLAMAAPCPGLSELIGPGGSIIRAIQDKLEVKITIPDTDWRPGRQVVKAKPAKVGVAGSKEACVQAKACITSIARYHHHEVTHPGMTHKEVDVPPEYLNFVRAAPMQIVAVCLSPVPLSVRLAHASVTCAVCIGCAV